MNHYSSNEWVACLELREARELKATIQLSGRASFSTEVGADLALHHGDGSPLNKVLGLGLAPLTAAELNPIEQLFSKPGAPTQNELASHADNAAYQMLCSRGYLSRGREGVGNTVCRGARAAVPATRSHA
jgi:hypothetical protein